MKFSGNKKFLYVFLPIIAVVAMVISIVGIVLANEKSTPLYEVIGEKAESSSETSGDDVVEEETYNISGCSFSGSGTLLHVKAGASYVVENCTFSGASTNYAIIVFGWLGGDADLTLKNCTIENCKAGAISVHGNILLDSTTIKDCTTENASVKNGGAIYVDADSDVTMSGDSVIQNCSSEGNGGAIYVRWCGSVTMNDNATIKECTSSDQGGAIYLGGAYSNSNGQCDLTMNGNSKIELCTATNQGGGVYQYGSFSNKGYTRLYENAQISQCSGSNGGGIYCHDMSPLEMYDSSSISINTAST